MSDQAANAPELPSAAAPSGAVLGVGDANQTHDGEAERVLAPAPAYQHLAHQMQVFLSRTDLQHGRKNKFFLQQTLELLADLDQHSA